MKKKLEWFFIHLELIVVALLVLVPIAWIIISSFNRGNSLASSTFVPEYLTVDNYIRLFRETNYGLWFFNTLQVAVVNTIVSVFIIMITAWIMSRFQFKGKKPYVYAPYFHVSQFSFHDRNLYIVFHFRAHE